MGTIQKIVDSLIKTSNDKKENLSCRYRDHSLWLGNELELIRKLIKQNPRDKFSLSGSKNVNNDKNINNNSTSSSSNNNINNNEDEVEIISNNNSTETSRQKRKSSESKTKDNIRDDLCSPEAKRSSLDIQLMFEKALDNAGLPRDLNKLKKENLLSEIESRGVNNFTMKSLKKDLVDTLKDLLLSEDSKISNVEEKKVLANECNEVDMSDNNNNNNEYQNNEEINNDEILIDNKDNITSNNIIYQSIENNVEESTIISTIVHDANKISPIRKSGSVMTEFRNLVKNNNQIAIDAKNKDRESDASRNERIHNEFESRQKRHNERKSQANQQIKSPVKEPTSLDKSDNINSPLQSIETTWMEVSSPVPNSPTPVVNNDMDSDSLQKEEEDIQDVNVSVNDISLEEEEEEEKEEEEKKNTSANDEVENNSNDHEYITQSDNNENELNNNDDNIEEEEDQENKLEVAVEEELEEEEVEVEVLNEEIKAEEVEIIIEKHTVSNKEISLVAVPVVENISKSPPSSPKISSKSNIPAIIKKPSNLMIGQSSFLDKAPVKPIVPALEKANKLRAAEEAKILQKKKEMEKRKAASSTSMQPVSTTYGTKSQSTWERMANGKPASKLNNTATTTVTTTTTTSNISNSSNSSKNTTSTPSVSSTSSQSHVSVPITPVVATITTPNVSESITEVVPQKKGLLAFLNKKTATVTTSSGMGFDINACELKPQIAPVIAVVEVVVPNVKEVVKKIEPVIAPAVVPVKIEAPVTVKVNKIEQETNNNVIDGSKIQMKVHSPGPFPPSYSPLVLKISNPNNSNNNNATISNTISSPIVTKARTSSIVTPASVKVAPVKVAPIQQQSSNLAQTQSALRDITQEVIEQEDDQYIIDDRESSGSSGSGTDDEAENDKQKRIPEWARSVNLKEALERQYGLNGHSCVDPDTIFHEVQTCNLEEIFGIKDGRNYSKRTSSAKWDADEITLVEKRTYRSQMGFAGVDAKSPASKTYR